MRSFYIRFNSNYNEVVKNRVTFVQRHYKQISSGISVKDKRFYVLKVGKNQITTSWTVARVLDRCPRNLVAPETFSRTLTQFLHMELKIRSHICNGKNK
jgi:hypothetical protein